VTRLIYIANMRLPTEKAHAVQIMQNCEAFAQAGADVTLWAARRFNPSAPLRQIEDVWAHYGVARVFGIQRLFCIDLMPLTWDQVNALSKLIFALQVLSFTLAALISAVFTPAEIYYTRDLPVALALSLVKPRRAIAYEPHRLWKSTWGKRLQALAVKRAGAVIPVTAPLADALITLGADPARVLVAHDGIRAERFAHVPDQITARQAVGWPEDAFIVGYMGQLQTMGMDKGVGSLVSALSTLPDVSIGLVGGPDDMAAQLREHWLANGQTDAAFLYAGQVSPDRIPTYLSAFDLCVMPLPYTEHYAFYASPLKLFEYMASGRAIIATDLPGWADVVQHEMNAYLIAPSDVPALQAAIVRLKDDPALRERLALAAKERVFAEYTWAARAQRILNHIQQGQAQ
jgi:glycosyltransferase involved in cell wall biosynthesis